MAANNNIQISDLDFDSIKTNLKTFLRGQNTFKDYDFEGSGLSVLLDLLAYNTHYNAYYLNMVGNEMFLDTAALRSSVVSHAKLLNYTPSSATAPLATINLVATNVSGTSLSLPKFTNFKSEAIDGVNYTFVTKDIYTVPVSGQTATFENVEILQGQPVSLSYTVDTATNPKQLFSIPDSQIDTATLVVQVQQSITNSTTSTYNLASGILELDGQSQVYFLQEGTSGLYEIYFGDGILGQNLIDGNIVNITYIVTNGSAASGANNFTLMDSIGGSVTVYPVTPANSGGDKESIDSIKFQAPKSYSAQGRAVSYEDYITAIQQNNLGFAIQSVNVWGGEDNIPPAYGQVFISIKPKNSYALTDSQKQLLLNDVIKPISVVTVSPTILDPDYTYLKITTDVVYDQKQTTLTSSQIQSTVSAAIRNYADTNLNTFNSTFSLSDLAIAIKLANPSIITSDVKVQVQKKFYPTLGVPKQYILNYGVELYRSLFEAGITSTPTMQYFTSGSDITLIPEVYIEEIPFAASGISSISILNPGFNYTETPTVQILGDGTGASAHAVVKNGYISNIVVDNSGNNYTQAIVNIINSPTDKSGTNGSAFATLQGQYGSLRTYYYNSVNNVKTILDNSIATVDYYNGTITFNNFKPFDINNDLGQLTLTANPSSTIISSSTNRIVTVDPYDPNSITVNVTSK
jgi:hypothetical protein